MAEFNFDNLVANLPDAFAKDKDSNNYKLLLIEKKIYDRILQIFKDVKACIDIDNCIGATLDNYGERLQVARGTSTDEQYRIRLKASIVQTFCDGSRDSIAEALAYVLSCSPNQIKLKGGEYAVSVIDIPLAILEQAKFTDEQITEIISELLPVGVHLDSVGYSGTFELGSTFGEKDVEKGLADVERTVGGELGMVRRS